MGRTNPKIYAKKPDLVDSRGDIHLLIWGDVAQWMVVDDELLSFLDLLNGRLPFKKLVSEHARRTKRPVKEVEPEVLMVLDELKQRGILGQAVKPIDPQVDAVSVANVTLNLTNRCNLRCPWCYNINRKTPEMDIGLLMERLKEAKGLFTSEASFIILGGEPLLMPERLLAALEGAEEVFSAPSLISTNGMLLTEDIIESLRERRVEVQVSIDGPTPETHDKVRGKGVFEKATRNVRALNEAGLYTMLSMVYYRHNLKDIEPYLDLALELGVKEARLIPMRMIGGGLKHLDSAPHQGESFLHLMELLERRPEFRPLLGRDYFSISMSICRFSSPRTGCGVGNKVLFIDADGKVYPCPNHVEPEHCSGDLHEQGLTDMMLRSPAMKKLRKQYHVDSYSACKSCTFRYWCAGDCRGEVLSLTGDPAAPSPHCEELKENFLRFLWLIAEGDTRLGNKESLPDGKKAKDSFMV